MALALAGCPGGDDGDTAASSTGQGSTSAATGSSGAATTTVSTSAGTAEGSSGSSGSGPGTGSSGTPGTGSTGSVDTGASGSSAGESGTTGAVCVEEQGSCANGEACCQGLTCCAGVPVPEGQEYCGMMCPDSDYSLKHEFAAVDSQVVLERVMALPITEWSYRSEDPSIRHLGPMAQDFKASFGLGSTDVAIAKVDADGVALASIQALGRRLRQSEAENAELRAALASLQARVDALEGAAR